MSYQAGEALQKAFFDAQFTTCMHCGTKVHQTQNVNGWQCCERNLVDLYKSGFTVSPNPQIKNL